MRLPVGMRWLCAAVVVSAVGPAIGVLTLQGHFASAVASAVPVARTAPAAPATPAATSGPGAAPGHFEPISFTAVSPSHWWVLGRERCGSTQCLESKTTTNAGASFRSLPAPRDRLGTASELSSITFANSNDGWIFGPKLYATEDGGRQWKAVSIPGTVIELAAGSDDAFAVVQPPEPPCARTGRCTPRTTPEAPLWRAAIGSDDWRADPATRSRGATVGLGVHGRSIWVIDATSSGDGLAIGSGLIHSAGSGARFTLEPEAADEACDYAPVSDTVVWSYCSGGHFMFAGRSTDAGAHFRSVAPLSSTQTTPNGYPNGSSLQPASSTTAVAANDDLGRSALIRTVDAGKTWQVVHRSLNRHGSWQVIGFTTARVGYALWTQEGSGEGRGSAQLWRTADAGATWSAVTGLR